MVWSLRRPAARVVLLDQANRVFLMHGSDPMRPEKGTWWEIPGGGIEPGETSQEAAARAGAGCRAATAADVRKFFTALGRRLGLAPRPGRLPDPSRRGGVAWVMPLDRTRGGWRSPAWRWEKGARLLGAEGPAGVCHGTARGGAGRGGPSRCKPPAATWKFSSHRCVRRPGWNCSPRWRPRCPRVSA